MSISAILWDYDGTLVDSTNKNMHVTRDIISSFRAGIEEKDFPRGLCSTKEYRRLVESTREWQELYRNHFGLSEEETLQAGPLWSKFQLTNQVPVDFFEGIKKIVEQFSFIPQGICSLNSADAILKELKQQNLISHFKGIFGYDNVPNALKPHADSFTFCLSQMNVKPQGKMIYIGDHETDTEFAQNAKQVLQKSSENKAEVISIAVRYSGSDTKTWKVKPDYEASTVAELNDLLNSLT